MKHTIWVKQNNFKPSIIHKNLNRAMLCTFQKFRKQDILEYLKIHAKGVNIQCYSIFVNNLWIWVNGVIILGLNFFTYIVKKPILNLKTC